MFKLNHISTELANRLANYLGNIGTPTENRILILSPKDQETMSGSIIIPGQAKEGVPREGVFIFAGPITEEYLTYRMLFREPGKIVTYGLYAGKEVDFWDDLKGSGIELSEDKWEFTVLALNEVIFVRNNNK